MVKRSANDLNEMSYDPQVNIKETIDTPKATDAIIPVCDKLLTSLHFAKINAECILYQINKMKNI
jgi:hypothetical protein